MYVKNGCLITLHLLIRLISRCFIITNWQRAWKPLFNLYVSCQYMAISMSFKKGSFWPIHHRFNVLWRFCRDLSARWWVLLENSMSTHFMLASLHVEKVLWLGTLILLLQVSRWASMRWLQLGSHLIMTKTTLADILIVGVLQWILHIHIRLSIVERGTCTIPKCIADDVCRALFTLVARHGKLTCSSLPLVTTSYQSIFLTF